MWVGGVLLVSNHQRPGAITNMTCQELSQAREMKEGRDRFLVISVRKHKTGTTGRARIVVKNSQIEMVKQYAAHIRPRLAKGDRLFPKMVLTSTDVSMDRRYGGQSYGGSHTHCFCNH